MSFVRDRKNTDYTGDCRVAFNVTRDFGYNARITRMMEIIQKSFSLSEWGLYKNTDSLLDSYFLDKLSDFFNDKEVDFTEIKEKIIETGDFLTSEKRMFETGKLEERIWGIFLALLPGNKRIENI